MFDRRLEHFEVFKYKAKAVFLELGLDDITFGSYVDVTSAREKLIKAAASQSPVKTETRSTQRVLTEEALQAKAQLTAMEKKSAQVARLLISRLSPSVSDRLRKTLPEEQHFDGIAVWNHLQITYGISKLASNDATNVEKLILDLLTLQWNKSTPFSKSI